MADKKISELTNITGANLADTDEFVVVDTSASETKAITFSELLSGTVNTTNVTAAGALMDSELTNITAVKALNQGVSTTDSPTFNVVTATSFSGDGSGLTGIEAGSLAAIAASKAVTAVDVFVYDTSKDSDGGAWRKRTQHTSWYNETLNTATRGSRREFPAVAVIVADATTLTIYDGDDPSLPMWMVFEVAPTKAVWRTASSVTMLNGKLVLGHLSGYGVSRIDFLSETSVAYAAVNYLTNKSLPLAQRNYGASFVTQHDGQAIVNATVNDVAMTVLPDAPIDPATGLPVPTIAVATDGGVSVIRDDGTVADITNSNSSYTTSFNVGFDSQNNLWLNQGSNSLSYSGWVYVFAMPLSGDTAITINTKTGSGDDPIAYFERVANADIPFQLAGGRTLIADTALARTGLAVYSIDYSTPSQTMASKITSTYNTGYQNGDIKGAFLADTDDTDLVGGELVTNGTFDTSSDWTLGTGWTISGGGLVASSASGQVTQDNVFGVTANSGPYWVTFDVTSYTSGTLTLNAGSGTSYPAGITGVGSYSLFVNNGGGTPHRLYLTPSALTATIDNVSVTLADADRSVSNKGLIVNGTVTRSPVATGAELVAYSGFSASNYLEQPYNADLDFGTGDFCVMGWITPSAASDWIVDRMEGRDGSSNLWGFNVWQSTSSPRFDVYENNANTTVTATTVMASGVWYFFTAVRRSGILEMYMQGNLEATTSGTARNISYTSTGNPPPLTIGARDDGSAAWLNGNAALIRISATAPTAEQIKKIYEDEKVLFQESAACTLYGASDAVTALAHDSDTGLLHVGTSAGRSVFQGLRRVSNTTTAVGTAISASNGLVVEE